MLKGLINRLSNLVYDKTTKDEIFSENQNLDVSTSPEDAIADPAETYLDRVDKLFDIVDAEAKEKLEQFLPVGSIGYFMQLANLIGKRTAVVKYEFHGLLPSADETVATFTAASHGYHEGYGADDSEGFGEEVIKNWGFEMWSADETVQFDGHDDLKVRFEKLWSAALKRTRNENHLSALSYYLSLHPNYEMLFQAMQNDTKKAFEITMSISEVSEHINDEIAFSLRQQYALLWTLAENEPIELKDPISSMLGTANRREEHLFEVLTGEQQLTQFENENSPLFVAAACYWAGIRAKLTGDKRSSTELFKQAAFATTDARAETLAARIELGLPTYEI